MYAIDGAGTDRLTVRHTPWLSWILGLLFIAGGAAVALLVTSLVRLQCDRRDGTCTLRSSTLLTAETTSWPVAEMRGAEIETVFEHGRSQRGFHHGTRASYRVVVLMRTGETRFTRFSSGTGVREKQAIAERIQEFAANPTLAALDVQQDERVPFFAVAGGLTLLGLLPWIGLGVSVCTLDAARQQLVVTRRSFSGRGRRVVPLAELVRASLSPGDSPGTASSCRIALELRGGEAIAFPQQRYPGRAQAAAAVEAINAFVARRLGAGATGGRLLP